MEKCKKLNIWCDGACIPNPGMGGYAAIILEDEVPTYAVMGYEKETTNNRMEMMAVIASLETIGLVENVQINVHSDSQYIINTMTKGWDKGYNIDLWDRIDCLNNKYDINWIKVKGHSGLQYNEECDALAEYSINNMVGKAKVDYDQIDKMLFEGVADSTRVRRSSKRSGTRKSTNKCNPVASGKVCSLREWEI